MPRTSDNRGGEITRRKRRTSGPDRRGRSGRGRLRLAIGALLALSALGTALVLSQPQGTQVMAKKCANCHTVSDLTALGLDAASAAGAVDAMVEAGNVTLSSRERAAVVRALSGE